MIQQPWIFIVLSPILIACGGYLAAEAWTGWEVERYRHFNAGKVTVLFAMGWLGIVAIFIGLVTFMIELQKYLGL